MHKINIQNIETIHKARLHTSIQHHAIKVLRSRFYMTGQQGSQTKFYDTLNDNGNLSIMHLIPVLMQEVPEYKDSYNEAKETVSTAIKNGAILPLSMEVMKYRPHSDPVVNVNGIFFRNLWRPSKIKPKKGDAQPFVDFLMLAMGGREDEVNYLLKWLALLVQEPLPKRKPPVAPYIFGNQQGQGKSLLARIMTEVLGESAVKSSSGPQALDDKNRVEFFSRTLFIADEAQLDKKANTLQAFKNLITSTTTDEALKNQSVRTHEVPARLMMLSNYAPAHLERDDRRHFVVHWDTGLRDEEKAGYFNKLIHWLEHDGYSIISNYLMEFETGDWDYAAAAMETEAKLEVISSHQGKWEQKFHDMVEENCLWFVDQSYDFNEWIEKGFNMDQLPYILEQLGWHRLQGTEGVYRHNHSGGKRTSHRFWFSPEAIQHKQGKSRIITYKGQTYTAREIYELQSKALDF